MTEGILWLRCLSIAGQFVCLVVLARRRLARRYPVFWVFLLLGLLHSAWALYRWTCGGHGEESATFRWALAAMYVAVAIEACLAQARHFRSLFSFAVDAIIAFVVVAAALGALVCWIGPGGLQDPGPVMLVCSGCCVLLMFSTAVFSTLPLTMRANVRWHVLTLQILMFGDAVAAGLGSAGLPGARLAGQILAAACPLICYSLWTIKLVPSGEDFLPPSEVPAEVLERLVAPGPEPAAVPPQPARPARGRRTAAGAASKQGGPFALQG
jgi:hypothetical protein